MKILHVFFITFAVLYALLFFAAPARAQAQGADIGGWAWNSILGWVSQGGAISDSATGEREGTFGVMKYDKDMEGREKPDEDFIEGWSWSSLYGFMCWGVTCETLCTRAQKLDGQCVSAQEVNNLSGSIDPPPFTDTVKKPFATISRETKDVQDYIKGKQTAKKLHLVKGWAKMITQKEKGWISLNGCTVSLNNKGECPSGKEYGIYFDPDTREFRGWAWSSLFGWLAFSGKTLYDTPYEFVINQKGDIRYEVRPVPASNKKIVVTLDGMQDLEAFLRDKKNKDQEFTYKDSASACLSVNKCRVVGFDEVSGQSAWATKYIGPWLQTKGGSLDAQQEVGTAIFSRKGFDLSVAGGFVAEQKYSGVYEQEVEEGGVKKVKKGVKGALTANVRCDVLRNASSQFACAMRKDTQDTQDTKDIREGGLALEFPKKSQKDSQKLASSIGSLQKKAFTTVSEAGKRNGYGYIVKPINGELDLNSVWTAGLQDIIYVYDASGENAIPIKQGTLSFGSPTQRNHIQLKNGAKRGGGAIVAYGADIKIYRPITYEQTPVNDLKKLASVAWIALKDKNNNGGNIIFDDCIPPMLNIDNPNIPAGEKNRMNSVPLSGLFFAEGKIQTGSGDGTKCLKAINGLNIGAEKKALLKKAFKAASELDAPITIEGIVMSTEFDLQRVYGGLDQGSELILDTGRAHINPPPGIEDIIRSLPVK